MIVIWEYVELIFRESSMFFCGIDLLLWEGGCLFVISGYVFYYVGFIYIYDMICDVDVIILDFIVILNKFIIE